MKKIVFLLILITFFIATSFKNVEAAPFSPSDQKAIQDFFKQFTNTRDPSTAPSPKASPTAPLNDSPTPSQNPTVMPFLLSMVEKYFICAQVFLWAYSVLLVWGKFGMTLK